MTPGKGAHERKERRGKESLLGSPRSPPRPEFFPRLPSADKTALTFLKQQQLSCQLCRYSPCHVEGEGQVSPSALKLSLRPGQGPSFGLYGESMPAPVVSAWLAGGFAHNTCSYPAACDSPPGWPVLLNLFPLSALHPPISGTIVGTSPSPHAGLVGLHFPVGLAKVWEKPFLSSHHHAVSKFIFEVVASAGPFLLYIRAASVNLMGQFVTGILSLGFFTTLLVPGSSFIAAVSHTR